MRVLVLSEAMPADLDEVLRLERSGFDHAGWSRDAWAAEVDGADRRVVLARDEEAGVLGAATFQVVPGADVADLHRVVVDPDHRGQRIGEELVVDGERWARAIGAAKMLLEVEEGNAPALALYRRLGFTQIARRENYYGAGHHALVMEKELADD